MNLYQNTDKYICHLSQTREEWLSKRIVGIAGSDSSTFIGMNPYKTNSQLWKEKKGLVKAKEISNDAIDHGNALEPVLRDWFKATMKEYEVQYMENAILQSKVHDFMLYSPDGLLSHPNKGKGILEIKTTLIQNSSMLEQWNGQIPTHYFIQTLHGMLVTDFDYVCVVAELRFAWERPTEIRTYYFSREEVSDDLKFLLENELHNWNEYYIKNQEPPTLLTL